MANPRIISSKEDEIRKLEDYYPKSDLRYIYDKNKEKLFKIITTIEDIQKYNKLTDENLEILENGLKENWNVIYYYHIGKYLAILKPYFREIEELLFKVLRCNNWMARRNVVEISELFKDKQLSFTILSTAIEDRSKKVIDVTIDYLIRYHLSDKKFKILLTNKLRNIEDLELKNNYEDKVSLYKNGYLIKESPNDRMAITIVNNRNSLTMLSKSKEEVRKIKNIKEYIESIRK